MYFWTTYLAHHSQRQHSINLLQIRSNQSFTPPGLSSPCTMSNQPKDPLKPEQEKVLRLERKNSKIEEMTRSNLYLLLIEMPRPRLLQPGTDKKSESHSL